MTTTTPPPSDCNYSCTTPPPPPRPAEHEESTRYADGNGRASLDLELPQLNSFPNLPIPNYDFGSNDRHEQHQRELEPLSRRLLPRPRTRNSNGSNISSEAGHQRIRDDHAHLWDDLRLPPLDDDSDQGYFWEHQQGDTNWLRQRPRSPLAVSQLNAPVSSDYFGYGSSSSEMAIYVAPMTPQRQQRQHNQSFTRPSNPSYQHHHHQYQDAFTSASHEWDVPPPQISMEPVVPSDDQAHPLVPIIVSQDSGRPRRTEVQINVATTHQMSGNITFRPLSSTETVGIIPGIEGDSDFHFQYSQSFSNNSSEGFDEDVDEEDDDLSYIGSRESTPTCCHSGSCSLHSLCLSTANNSNHPLLRSCSGSCCATRYFVRESSVRTTGSIDLKKMGSATSACLPHLRRTVSAPPKFIAESFEDCYQRQDNCFEVPFLNPGFRRQ